MVRPPPRRVARRASATRASYYREGRAHLLRAMALHPDADPLDALALATEIPREGADWKLKAATARRYLEDHRVMVAVLVRAARRAGSTRDPASVMTRIEAALRSRRGRPAVARGASRKVRDAAEDEARLTFIRLKAVALRDRTASAAAAALYVLAVPRVGCRPVELCGSVVEGTILSIPNAKRGTGQERWRRLDLSRHPASVIEAVRLLTVLAPAPGDGLAFELWRNSLASSLARASLSAACRRLALYSFRHIAIATWEKAGFSAREIADMAGHLSVHTARAHYARARSGWAIQDLPGLVAGQGSGVDPVRGAEPPGAAEVEVQLPDQGIPPQLGPAPDTERASHRSLRPQATSIAAWFETLDARIDDLHVRLDRKRGEINEAAPSSPQPDPAGRSRG